MYIFCCIEKELFSSLKHTTIIQKQQQEDLMWPKLFTLVGHLGKRLTVLDCTHVSCIPCICVRRFNVVSFFICNCVCIVWFQKIPPPPPPGGSMEIPRGGGGGGLKGRNLQGVWGVPTRRIFHRVVKDAIDPTRHTCIYGFFWLVAQQKLEVDALSRKKKFKMSVSNVLFFARSSLSPPL